MLLAASGAVALIGVSSLPGFGAAAPPGGATLTRLYDPASATTTFTVDVGRAADATLSLVTCPGARVVSVDGPAAAETVESVGGTTEPGITTAVFGVADLDAWPVRHHLTKSVMGIDLEVEAALSVSGPAPTDRTSRSTPGSP